METMESDDLSGTPVGLVGAGGRLSATSGVPVIPAMPEADEAGRMLQSNAHEVMRLSALCSTPPRLVSDWCCPAQELSRRWGWVPRDEESIRTTAEADTERNNEGLGSVQPRDRQRFQIRRWGPWLVVLSPLGVPRLAVPLQPSQVAGRPPQQFWCRGCRQVAFRISSSVKGRGSEPRRLHAGTVESVVGHLLLLWAFLSTS